MYLTVGNHVFGFLSVDNPLLPPFLVFGSLSVVVCGIVRSILILILSLVSSMMTMMLLSCNAIVIVYIFTVKGYIRKGHALLAMKNISKARQAFQTAVDLDPNSAVRLTVTVQR